MMLLRAQKGFNTIRSGQYNIKADLIGKHTLSEYVTPKGKIGCPRFYSFSRFFRQGNAGFAQSKQSSLGQSLELLPDCYRKGLQLLKQKLERTKSLPYIQSEMPQEINKFLIDEQYPQFYNQAILRDSSWDYDADTFYSEEDTIDLENLSYPSVCEYLKQRDLYLDQIVLHHNSPKNLVPLKDKKTGETFRIGGVVHNLVHAILRAHETIENITLALRDANYLTVKDLQDKENRIATFRDNLLSDLGLEIDDALIACLMKDGDVMACQRFTQHIAIAEALVREIEARQGDAFPENVRLPNGETTYSLLLRLKRLKLMLDRRYARALFQFNEKEVDLENLYEYFYEKAEKAGNKAVEEAERLAEEQGIQPKEKKSQESDVNQTVPVGSLTQAEQVFLKFEGEMVEELHKLAYLETDEFVRQVIPDDKERLRLQLAGLHCVPKEFANEDISAEIDTEIVRNNLRRKYLYGEVSRENVKNVLTPIPSIEREPYAKTLEQYAEKLQQFILDVKSDVEDLKPKFVIHKRFLKKQDTSINVEFETDANKQMDESFLNKVFVLSQQDVQKFIPEGLAGMIEKDLVDLNIHNPVVGFVVRKEAFVIRDKLVEKLSKNFAVENGVPPFLILQGRLGCGKSAILNEVVFMFRKMGWIVAFVPNGKETNFVGGPRVTESCRDEGMYDQPDLAQAWCTAMLAAHKEQLKQLPMQTEIVPNFRPQVPHYQMAEHLHTIMANKYLIEVSINDFKRTPTTTLADLLEFGTKNPHAASDVIYYFRRELNLVTKFPVLIVVDGMNTFYNRSEFDDPNCLDKRTKWYGRHFVYKPLYPKNMVLPSCFMNYHHHGLMRGTVLAAIDNTQKSDAFEQHLREQMLHFGYKPKDIIIEIPRYQIHEHRAIMDFYEANGLFTEIAQGTKDYVYYLTDGNGKLVKAYASGLVNIKTTAEDVKELEM